MLAALSSGRTLVVDRYAYSGAAFTAAKGIPGLDLAWCKVRHGAQERRCQQLCPFVLWRLCATAMSSSDFLFQHLQWLLACLIVILMWTCRHLTAGCLHLMPPYT